MAELLRVEQLSAGYGDAVVLFDMSFAVEEGEAVAVLGRNGMGKTTLIASLAGATRITAGTIRLHGGDITRLPSHRRAAAGIGWVPQERDIFPSLTVEENLTAVARPGAWTSARVLEMFPALAERRRNLGDRLSGGEQQMLAVGRALVLNPALLLLDEPLEGLAPIIVQQLLAVISEMIAGGGMAMLMVEQHARQILGLTHRALILERGRIVHEAPSAELRDRPDVLERWLGVSATAY
jgi:branched-chain amino acid transport system ATP-binding protein